MHLGLMWKDPVCCGLPCEERSVPGRRVSDRLPGNHCLSPAHHLPVGTKIPLPGEVLGDPFASVTARESKELLGQNELGY